MVITGEAGEWMPALSRVIGPHFLHTRRASTGGELLDIVQAGEADVALIDDEVSLEIDLMRLLRLIRRLVEELAVIVVTPHRERRWLEGALELAAFSVIVKPVGLEMLLRQIHGIMSRLKRIE
jgi:DNA-binding NtrC family response regulator